MKRIHPEPPRPKSPEDIAAMKQKAMALFSKPKTHSNVRRWLQRMGVPRRDQSDLAQDTVVAALCSFHTYDPIRARLERWLNRIAVHVASHYHERAQHRREELCSDPPDREARDRPDVLLECAQDEAQLKATVRSARAACPEVDIVIAHDLDEVPMSSCAALRGLPLSTAYKWRARGLRAVYDRLQDGTRNQPKRSSGTTGSPGIRRRHRPSRI